MKRLSSLLILILSTHFLSAQSNAEFGVYISAQAAKNDFKILENSLWEVHSEVEPLLEDGELIPDIIIDYQPDERLAAKDKELEYLLENHISR